MRNGAIAGFGTDVFTGEGGAEIRGRDRGRGYAPVMGCFRVGCRIENQRDRSRSAQVPGILVDTGSELSWIREDVLESIGVERGARERRFAMANGQVVTRPIGFVILRVDRSFTTDEVVFARPDDQQLLGARTLEGLNLMVDPQDRRLIPGGATLATGNVGVADHA